MTIADFGLPVKNLPAWVQRWMRARAANDYRLLPEQVPGIRSLHLWNGSPVGEDAKHVGYRSSYEPDIHTINAVPTTDLVAWIQPEEFVEPLQ